jgi:hypothetical protein
MPCISKAAYLATLQTVDDFITYVTLKTGGVFNEKLFDKKLFNKTF